MSLKSTCIALAGTAVLALSAPATAEDDAEKLGVTNPAAYLMPEAEEIALSRSAAIDAVSANASVLVLQSDGSYKTAVEGSNGWTCFTGRSWTGPAAYKDGKRAWGENHFNPAARAPQCFNAAATSSILKWHRITTWHFMQGASIDEVDQAVGRAVETGKIKPPRPGAMSYMHSPKQVLAPDGGRFHPHVMLYTPYATQESYGTGNPAKGIPLLTDGGSIFATTVILSPNWSDGTPATGH